MIGARVPIVVVSLGADGAAAYVDGRAVARRGLRRRPVDRHHRRRRPVRRRLGVGRRGRPGRRRRAQVGGALRRAVRARADRRGRRDPARRVHGGGLAPRPARTAAARRAGRLRRARALARRCALVAAGCGGARLAPRRPPRAASRRRRHARARAALVRPARARGSSGASTAPRGDASSPGSCSRARACFWTHNDSGDAPRVFALGRDGRLRGEVAVTGAEHVDWEDIAIRGRTLYVGDIGDNLAQRPEIVVYRLRRARRRAPRASPPSGSRCATPTARTTPRRCSSTRAPARSRSSPRTSAARPASTPAAPERCGARRRCSSARAGDHGRRRLRRRPRDRRCAATTARSSGRAAAASRSPARCGASPASPATDLLAEGQGETLALTRDGRAFYTVPEGPNPPLRRYARPEARARIARGVVNAERAVVERLGVERGGRAVARVRVGEDDRRAHAAAPCRPAPAGRPRSPTCSRRGGGGSRRRQERRLRAERRHHVEAERVGVERVGRRRPPRTRRWTWPITVPRGRPSKPASPAARTRSWTSSGAVVMRSRDLALPDRAAAGPVDLDPVVVGVAEVDRLADDSGPTCPVSGTCSAAAWSSQRARSPRSGTQQREVVEPAVAVGGPRARLLGQHEQVLAAGAERDPAVVARVHAQPDRGLVVRQRAREVRDREVHGAHARIRRDRHVRGEGTARRRARARPPSPGSRPRPARAARRSARGTRRRAPSRCRTARCRRRGGARGRDRRPAHRLAGQQRARLQDLQHAQADERRRQRGGEEQHQVGVAEQQAVAQDVGVRHPRPRQRRARTPRRRRTREAAHERHGAGSSRGQSAPRSGS